MNVGMPAFGASYCCVPLKLSAIYQPAKAPVASDGCYSQHSCKEHGYTTAGDWIEVYLAREGNEV
jgi:hypothetical protein